MFKTNFSGHKKTWGEQKNLGTLPLNDPIAVGLAV